MGPMKFLVSIGLNVLQWAFFALWSLFWMSAAILCGISSAA